LRSEAHECGEQRRSEFSLVSLSSCRARNGKEESKAAMLAHTRQLKEGPIGLYTALFTEKGVYSVVYSRVHPR
jgi:hypothetical protein